MDVLDLDAPAAPGNAMLAGLVVLGAVILSLEILQHLLVARVLAAFAMMAAWFFLLSPAAQVRTVLYAVVSHGVSEGVAQWRANFPVVFARNRDRCAMLWLLFWVRVFVWGATLGALSGFDRRASYYARGGNAGSEAGSWTSVVAIGVYYEVVEVLLLMYFSAEPLSYRLGHRVVNWGAVLSICSFERSVAWMQWIMGSPVLAGMSPVALVSVFFAVMWASMLIPWNAIARQAAPPEEDFYKATALRDHNGHTATKTRVAYVFHYAHEEGSSEDTALDTASDDEYESR